MTAPSFRGFMVYAREDARLVGPFHELLRVRLDILRTPAVSLWWDRALRVGDPWDQEIRAAIHRADFGLVLLSPAMLASGYIRRVELPELIRSGAVIMPVGLQRVDLHRADLQGLDARQIYLHRPDGAASGRWFADLAGQNRARFCDGLLAEIVDRLTASVP